MGLSIYRAKRGRLIGFGNIGGRKYIPDKQRQCFGMALNSKNSLMQNILGKKILKNLY
jgi:hypothetical protein